MVQGAELIPYNIDSVLGQDTCIIHEGELDAASSLATGFKSVISVTCRELTRTFRGSTASWSRTSRI